MGLFRDSFQSLILFLSLSSSKTTYYASFSSRAQLPSLSFSLFSSQAKRDFLNQANDILSTSPGEDILLQLLFHSMMLLLFCLPVGFLVFFHFSIFSRLQNNNQNFLGVYFKSLFLSLCDQIYIRSRLKMQKIRKNLQTSTLFIANCMPKKEKESFFLLIRINFRNRQRETEVNSFS